MRTKFLGRQGQVTVLILLLGILGLTVGLSTASKSLSDLKQASYVDVGTKALAAAESGMEAALNDLANNNSTATCGAPGSGPAIAGITSVQYTICGADKNSVQADVAKDDVFDVDLSQTAPYPKGYYVYWDGLAPVEISLLNNNNSTSYLIDRFSVNPVSGGDPTNNFSSAVPGGNCNDATFANCYGLYTGGANPARRWDQLIRVKPVPNSAGLTKIKVEAVPPGGTPNPVLYGAYYTLTAWATTSNGTVRKIQVVKTPAPGLPAIYDNVLFSGGSLTKN